MKETEKRIAHLVSSQFPAFYHEEGPVFIAFIKAYYEWLEQYDVPANDAYNVTYQARSLPEYRDIDTTLDKFLVQFKEKYLKNIQFDIATNKPLLIKNAMNLYRSKGTERSVDLFFKLVYGSDAEVFYPSEKVFRLSDGTWEKPQYLEIAYNEYNINYVGKQIVGARSGATAFVERYIRRKTQRGYVDLLYISNIQGKFFNDEVIGIKINNNPTFTKGQTTSLIGSVRSATIISRGSGFSIGDIVTLTSSNRGTGAIARVANTTTQSGVVVFDLQDGGFGYSLTSDAIISEKVITIDNVDAMPSESGFFRIFEEVVQPNINVAFSSATANITVGDVLTRYVAGSPVANGVVVDVSQVGTTGSVTVGHINGPWVNTSTYYTTSNAISLFANTIEDRTISGKVMGLTNTFMVTVNNATDTFAVGDVVQQGYYANVVASGTISLVNGNILTISNTNGPFKDTDTIVDYSYTIGTGTITANSGTRTVTGSGTMFDVTLTDKVLYETGSNTSLGRIQSVTNTTVMTLYANSVANVAASGWAYSTRYKLEKVSNKDINADVINVKFDVGVYNIRKYVQYVSYASSNNDSIVTEPYIHQYTEAGELFASGKVITGTLSANAGTLSVVSTYGSFNENYPIYTEANTATANLSELTFLEEGGDYIQDANTRMFSTLANTYMSPQSFSFGTGADFNVGTLTENETVFTNSDLLNGYGVGYTDNGQQNLTIAANTGFTFGDIVIQDINKKGFNSNTSLNAATGFITMGSANTRFLPGDIVYYQVTAGNTAITGLRDGDPYYVYASNSTGLILSYPWTHDVPINSTSVTDFATGALSETGHRLYHKVAGTIENIGATSIIARDVYGGQFSITGGTPSTTVFANSNLLLYGANTTNTAMSATAPANTVITDSRKYMSMNLRQEGYGFPKYSAGNIKTRIFECLSFQELNIGVITSITNVNPGSDYSVDPFVLVYEPGTVGYGKDDFILEITGATKSYLDGERVIQTLPNETTATLQVDSGVYGNTFSQVITTFNSEYDANSSNEFIFMPSNTIYSFNANTGVDSNAEFITLGDNQLVIGDFVRYKTSTGNTALTGLSNNSFYYVVFANSTGVAVSATEGGANVNVTASATVESGHFFIPHSNPYSNNDRVVYTTPTGNTVVTGLANGTQYFAVFANSIGMALSLTEGGANVDITANVTGGESHYITSVPGFLPLDSVYMNVLKTFNANTDIVTNSITLSPQPYSDGDYVNYYTDTGNTAIAELGNNSYWYVVGSNTTAIQLSATEGGLAETLTPVAFATDSGHNILAVASANVKSVYTEGSNSFVIVKEIDNTFATNYVLYSNTNQYVTANVSNVATAVTAVTAEGIVIDSNTSSVHVKRVNFVTDFVAGSTLTGQISAAESTVASVNEILDVYPIGLNAQVDGDASVANGQVSELAIIDSGFGYSNNELVAFASEDGSITGTARVIIDGHGVANGYYRGTKGFISHDNKIHDGDYYQEYSYEVLSKISVDKYADMFKKVMHLAGTKFFGSVVVETEESANAELITSGTEMEISFNSSTDVDSIEDIIVTGIINESRTFNPSTSVDSNTEFITIAANPFANGDYLLYTTEVGNTALTGLTNNSFYYVITANSSGCQLSETANGAAVNLLAGVNEWGHNLRSYTNPFSGNDYVRYDVGAGNTAITGLTDGDYYYVINATAYSISLSNTLNGNVINITAGSVEDGHYLTKIITEDDS